jgi:signal transduction histidine kinase
MFIYFLSKIKKSKAELIVQQKINDAGFKAEQIERERIARELHDGVGQKLSVMTMQLSLKQPNLQLATELANTAIVDIRTISHNLLPANIRLGIISTVLNFVEEIKHSQSQCNITVEFDEKVKEIVMTEQRTLNIFRIIQEFVQNSLKYSAAKNIIIKFIVQNNKLELNLSDDGIGFDLNQVRDKNGIGLKNIQSRVEQLNGSIQMNSKKDMGTHFIIKLINE